MHTETEHAELPGPTALHKLRFWQSEDTRIGVCAAWTLGLLIFTLAGFYFGTIAGHDNHPEGRHLDLQVHDLQNALPYAGAGLVVGILFALWMTFGYTPAKLKEIQLEDHAHGH